MINHKGTATLETERLLLRRLTTGDAQEAYDSWTNDPEVTRFLRWNAHENVDVTMKWITDNENKYSDPAFYEWGIQLKKTGRLIGAIGAVDEDGEPGRTEIGYCIGKAFWNQGYMTEALKCVVSYLSGDVGIKGFVAKHAVDNPASGAVLTHTGFGFICDSSYQSFDGTREFESRVYNLDIP
jgi:ribosomal-protein-alanine N-acetyltransferase